MTMDILADYLEAAIEAARRAGAVLETYRSHFRVHQKARFDLVTDADLESQRSVREVLGGRFPGHAFLEEEDKTSRARPGPQAPPTWIIDPLDGTTNYVHGFPVYCVSIGLQVAGDLVVGVIFDPARQELFSAARGLGARLGKERLQTSQAARLEEALIANEAPYDGQARDQMLEEWRLFVRQTQAIRQTGSTALDLAHLAAGRLDGYWSLAETHPWDVAAGVVLVREAGGQVTNTKGGPFDPFTPDILASNGPLHSALVQGFAPYSGSDR